MNRALALMAVIAGVLLLGAPPAAAAPGPSNAPQYWFDTWNIFDLWDSGVTGQGVRIAEIDTGVNAQLAELTGRVLPGTDLGESGDGRTDRELSQFGHGTAMASIMVARPGLLNITGLAPSAKVLPIAVPLNGTSDAGRPDRLADAIRYGADHGAKVISMSLGGQRFARTDSSSCPDDEQAAIFHAMRMGAIVIASVGNTGPRKNTVEEPGVCLGVVSVGAVDRSGQVADFSARQPYLTLVAPGVNIPSLGRVAGAAYSGDGTSQATALVSAAAALVWSKYPTLTGRQVVTRLLATLDNRGPHSDSYGYGLLNAGRAVTARVADNAPNPVYDLAEPFLKRDTVFGSTPRVPTPPPAAKSVASTGRFEVGSAPRITRQVQYGLGAAAAGGVALLVLVLVGLRRRRARARAAQAALAAEPWLPPPPVGPPRPLPHPGGTDEHRPRPRPV
ncbi:MAG: S8 family serine peptidase [Jatrophihabitans sp.]